MVAAAEELKDELFDLLDEVEDRGMETPQDLREDILEVVSELQQESLVWSKSPALGGRWRLRYTSAKTYANNLGLTGYARDLAGVSTPETFMEVETQFKRLVYEEPLKFNQGSIASMLGRFAGADAVQVECIWSETRDGVMAVESQRVVVGERSWEPADRQDKAVRALSAGRPVFLDAELLVLKCKPDYIIWVFERD